MWRARRPLTVFSISILRCSGKCCTGTKRSRWKWICVNDEKYSRTRSDADSRTLCGFWSRRAISAENVPIGRFGLSEWMCGISRSGHSRVLNAFRLGTSLSQHQKRISGNEGKAALASPAYPQKVPCQGFFVESGLKMRPLSDASGERLRPVRRKRSSLLRKKLLSWDTSRSRPSENQKQAGNLQKGIARLDHFMLRFFLILRYPLLIRPVR